MLLKQRTHTHKRVFSWAKSFCASKSSSCGWRFYLHFKLKSLIIAIKVTSQPSLFQCRTLLDFSFLSMHLLLLHWAGTMWVKILHAILGSNLEIRRSFKDNKERSIEVGVERQQPVYKRWSFKMQKDSIWHHNYSDFFSLLSNQDLFTRGITI